MEIPKISQSIRLQGSNFETYMRDLNVLLQRLIDSKTKPNSILCFCKDLYEFKEAAFNYENAPSRAIQRKRYKDYTTRHSLVRDWLVTFRLDSTYIPEDFIDDTI